MVMQHSTQSIKTGNLWLGIVFSAFLLVTLSGCPAAVVGGAAAGVTGVVYYNGELKAQVEAPPDRVMDATQQAFDYFRWSTVEFKASRTDGIAKAQTATGKDVKVQAEARLARVSEIGIRVGTFGDKGISQLLLSKITEYLASADTEPDTQPN